jgi:two-component system OmpR family sensor kinase
VRGPRTLTARLVATLVVLVALVSVLVITASALVMSNYLTGRLDQDVRGAVSRAANPRPGGFGNQDDGDTPGTPNQSSLPGVRGFGQKPGTVVMVIDESTKATVAGFQITESAAKTLSTASQHALAKVPTDKQAHTVDLGMGTYRVAAQTDSNGNRVIVGQPLSENRALLTRLLMWSALFAVLFVLLAAYVGLTLVRRQLRPLREVASTAHDVTRQQLASGAPDLNQRVDEHLTDPDTEVGQVGHALNTLLDHMSDALAARHRSEQQVRQFVGDASHELRTPLSTIRGYAELSRRTPDDSAALSNAMAKVETETDRMSRLVEDMLLLARLDSGRPLERGEVDLTKLLLESVADARVVDSEHQWRLDLPDEPIGVVGDEQRLHQLFTNLLGNARHHTPPGTTVTVSVRPGEHVVVEVHDDGPGLPQGLQEHAFERFTRGDSSRTRSSGGAGLGLSLVSAIAHAHSGTAAVHSRPGDTTFRISLPSA